MPSTVDCFYAAVAVLASEGRMKQRLLKAFSENLQDVDQDELPVAVREPFADLRRRLHEVPPQSSESRICASIRKMSNFDASDCASVVLDIYAELMKQPVAVSMRAPAEEPAEVPPFLVKSAS